MSGPDELRPPPPNPVTLIDDWLPGEGLSPPQLMVLSTLGRDGYPESRALVLTARDGLALRFHTDTRSRKVAQLAAVPRASATFVWPELRRQLVVVGDVTAESDQQCAQAYAARSPYLRALAWLNTDELAQKAPDERRAVWADFEREHEVSALDPPETWTGYRLTPTRLAFWFGDQLGPSTRLVYERANTSAELWDVSFRAG